MIKIPNKRVILKIHERSLAKHGGADGIKDAGAVEAAIHRPQHLIDYGNPDLFDIAAALVFSITKHRHPFTDGNKRVGVLVCITTILTNGYYLDVGQKELYDVMISVADGSMSEEEFANYCRDNSYESGVFT